MSRQLPSLPFLLLSLLLTLAGCGNVVGPNHPGEPLVTIRGQMNTTPDARVTGPVRLAFVWYPQWLAAEDTGGSQGGPVDVVTEDVVYEGSFPANYSFHIYNPPPESVLEPLGEGLRGKGAFGILLAYQDGNGNAKLDTIATNGAPVDRIIGSSLLTDPTSAAFTVIYVTTEQPAETGLKPGFNLIQAVNSENSAVVPLDTHMPLTLTQGGPFYDALVCEAGWLTFLFLDVCGLDGGGIFEPIKLAVGGRVVLEGSKAKVELRVDFENTPLQDAAVTLAGRTLPYDAEREAYVLEEEDTALLAPGGSFELVVNGGGESIRRTFQVPGDFDITSPTADEQVSASQPLELRWTASQGAAEYYVRLSSGTAGGGTIVGEGALSHTFDTTGAGHEGTVQVEARIRSLDIQALVTVALVREHTFTFAP
ncbi:hypothetical protein JQX13_42335 [Archangium violaceum]|uniref:hypothetical protein n=1 Tax=Archangium violaceum TaxID=83451 RepID=UPI00193BFE3E|nr:hypothetical protein [Archangium violaceum]QRK06653.1 hypothetical protein JQX13_42335 [Archangium violaceum]